MRDGERAAQMKGNDSPFPYAVTWLVGLAYREMSRRNDSSREGLPGV